MEYKVIYILDFVSLGGVERLTFDFLKNTKHSKYNIKLIILQGGSYLDAFVKEGIDVEVVPGGMLGPLSHIWNIRRVLRREKPGIIHTHNIKGAIYALIACFGKRIKRIRSLHHTGTVDYLHNMANKVSMIKSHANIFVSASFKKYLVNLYKLNGIPRPYVVYNGIDLKRFRDVPVSIREELSIDKDKTLIGMVGNFVELKDQMTICRAMDQIKDEFPDAHLLFVGTHNGVDKYYMNDCVDYCTANGFESRLHIISFRSDVPSILKELDLFVFSTLGDSFGIALVEAMAAGVPTIASDIDAVEEITSNGIYSQLFKTGDENELAGLLRSFLTDRTGLLNIAEKAKIYVERSFDIDTHIQNTFKVYDEVLNLS